MEELFGDLKRHGLDPHSTHLRHIERLSRLSLLVILLYLWLVAIGSQVFKAGTRRRADRRDRRDLSLFQIGLRSIEVSHQWAAPPDRVAALLESKLSGRYNSPNPGNIEFC